MPMRSRCGYPVLMILALCSCMAITGCKSLIVEQGVAARRVPKELLAKPKANKVQIDLALLRQDPQEIYRLGPDDVLGIYIETITGPSDQPPPISRPQLNEGMQRGSSRRSQLSVGYPVPVNQDGTISLPLVEPIKVEGLTVREAEDEIRKAYTVTKKLLEPGKDRIIVNLMEKRTYQILVIREDSEFPQSRTLRVAETPISTQRGRGFAIDLVAGENDVLHALTETGGLPGIDAVNEVVVLRARFDTAKERSDLIAQIQSANVDPCAIPPTFTGEPGIVRIPLRLPPGESPSFTKQDIILKNGDIIFVDSRSTDVFFTGGALSGGVIPLPRDSDLDVLQAVALAGGPVGGGGAKFTPGSVLSGVGSFGSVAFGVIPPSRCIIVRQLPPNGQFSIQVNLKRALKDPQERILIQPGDLVVVSYSPLESVLNLVFSTFPFNVGWTQLAFQ